MSRGKRKNGTAKLGLALALLLIILVLQACGKSGELTQGSSGGNAAPASGEPKRDVPAVLNFGFVGSTKWPTGAEGWGFYKGIIQEELKKYGITEVKVTGFKIGPDLNEAGISERVDLGSSGDTPAINARATGAKTKLITQPDIESVSVLIAKNDGPKSVAELKGKTVAVVKGSLMHRYIVGLLKEQNVKDVKLISIGSNTADSLAALSRGEVDAVAATDYLVYNLMQKGGYTILDDARKHPDLLATTAIVATDKYLSKFPDFPKIWNEVRLKALNDLKAHAEEYYKFVAENTGTPLEGVRELYPVDSISAVNFTDAGLKRLEGSKKFLVEEKLAEKDFDLNQWIAK
jgi:ABC-type nitrate/sulfonate/bicarbonate transport system substrate-binding protein